MPLESLPLPDDPVVHLHREGRQHGPMSRRELHRRVRVGEAGTEDHFWLPAMEGWETIGAHPELFRDLEAPEPAGAPETGAGTVMIPRSALVDLGDDEPRGADLAGDAGNAGASTMLISTPLGEEDASDGEQVGAATVRLVPGSELAAQIAEIRESGQRRAAQAANSADGETPVPRSESATADDPDAYTETHDPETLPSSEEDGRLAVVFGDLVEGTRQIFEERQLALHVGEVFLGALVAGALDLGYSLIDLEADAAHHHLRFENLESRVRLVLRLRRFEEEGLPPGRVLSQKASVLVAHGQEEANAQQIVTAARRELEEGFQSRPTPGTISVDGDLQSGHVYALIELLLPLDAYLAEDFAIDHELITDHLRATLHSLRADLGARLSA